jgi:predicted nucleic acid-binding protein
VIVVDASVILDVLLRGPGAESLDFRLFLSGETLHAPHLIDVEVAHVVRRRLLAGEIDPDRGRAAITDLGGLRLHRYPHIMLIPRIWELRNNLTAYDASYVALAEVLKAPLLTRDRPLSRSSGHRARFELI